MAKNGGFFLSYDTPIRWNLYKAVTLSFPVDDRFRQVQL